MSLNAPKQVTFIVAVVVAVLGLIAMLVQLGALSTIAPWIILLAFLILALGCLLPNL